MTWRIVKTQNPTLLTESSTHFVERHVSISSTPSVRRCSFEAPENIPRLLEGRMAKEKFKNQPTIIVKKYIIRKFYTYFT